MTRISENEEEKMSSDPKGFQGDSTYQVSSKWMGQWWGGLFSYKQPSPWHFLRVGIFNFIKASRENINRNLRKQNGFRFLNGNTRDSKIASTFLEENISYLAFYIARQTATQAYR